MPFLGMLQAAAPVGLPLPTSPGGTPITGYITHHVPGNELFARDASYSKMKLLQNCNQTLTKDYFLRSDASCCWYQGGLLVSQQGRSESN